MTYTHGFVLLACVVTLLASLLYTADMAERYVKAAVVVYCEQYIDFDKCSLEFKEKTSQLMKER